MVPSTTRIATRGYILMKDSLCGAILASIPLAFIAPACAQENVDSMRVELDTAHLRSRPDPQQSRRVTFDIPLAMVAPERRRSGPVGIIILHAKVEDPANPTILPSATPSISAPKSEESFDIIFGLTPDPAYPDCRPSACRDLVAQEMEDSLASNFERTETIHSFVTFERTATCSWSRYPVLRLEQHIYGAMARPSRRGVVWYEPR
jgi:hypothetical protein